MKISRWYLRTTLAACAVATLATAMLFAFTHPALAAKPVPPPPPPPADPAFVYSAGTDLRIMNADGTNDTLVLAGASYVDPRCAWSPDGQQIVFSSGTVGAPELEGIHVVNTDGSGRRMLTPSWLFAEVAWSPVPLQVGEVTSDWILFNDIVIDPATGSGPLKTFAIRSDATLLDQSSRVLLTDPTDGWGDDSFAWSPDGSRFATYAKHDDPSGWTYEIRVYTLADMGGQLGVSQPEKFSWPPAGAAAAGRKIDWARTQDKLVIALKRLGESFSRLATLDLTDGTCEFLEGIPELRYGNLAYPCWSPDDTQVAFVLFPSSSKYSAKRGLYVLDTANPTITAKIPRANNWQHYDWLR